MVRVAVSAPDTEGVYVMLIVQAVFEARVLPHVEVVVGSAKPAAFVPLIAVEEMLTDALVLFVNVTVFAALGLPMP